MQPAATATENKKLDRLFSNRLFLHISFWITYLCFYGFLWGSYDDNYQKSFTCELAEMAIKLPLVYLVAYPIIHRYLFERKYWEFFGYMLLGVLLASMLQRMLYYYMLYPMFFTDRVGSGLFNTYRIFKSITNINSLIILLVAIKTLKKWYQDQQMHKSLEKEKLEAELKYLKSQVHPHFLFNTLNNLYSLTLKKSDNAPELVLKLSELMSYMLYDANAAQVPLSKEIQYLQNYIALEKIRYAERLDVAFNIGGQTAGKMIAPMLLLPFVENGFKHGASGDLDTVWTVIDLTVHSNRLVFKMENSKPADPETSLHSAGRNGIGLSNVQRRLDLLYGNNYDLKIFDEPDSFLVVLKIELQNGPAVATDSKKVLHNVQ